MKVLESYQEGLLAKVSEAAPQFNRICLQAKTGAGKTLMAAHLIQRAVAKMKRVLFVADRRILIDNAVDKFREEGIECSPLMAGKKLNWDVSVFVGSKDTLIARVVKSKRWKLPQIDLVIVDECHRGGGEYLAFLSGLKCFVLGLTATPIANGRPLEFYSKTIIGPSDQLLVESGRLVPVSVFAPNYFSTEGIPRVGGGEFSPSAMAKKQAKIVGDVVSHWRRIANGKRTICFASNLEHARSLRDQFNGHGQDRRKEDIAEYMDAETPDGEENNIRGQIWDRLREGATKIVCVFGVGTEGLDIPEIECVILAIACGSIAGYLQRVGRGRRSSPGKTHLIVIDHGSNCWRFGMPTDDVDWELAKNISDDEPFEHSLQKKNADDESKWEIICPGCAAVFRGGSKCPNCGRLITQMVKKGKQKFFEDGCLIQVKDAGSADHVAAGMLKAWISACYIAKARKGNLGMASHIFKGKSGGAWPHECGATISPLPQGADFATKAEDWLQRHPSSKWTAERKV